MAKKITREQFAENVNNLLEIAHSRSFNDKVRSIKLYRVKVMNHDGEILCVYNKVPAQSKLAATHLVRAKLILEAEIQK